MGLGELVILGALGVLCWTLSAVAAGGGALTFIPAASFFLDPQTIPPVLAFASLLSSVQRTWMYRREIAPKIVAANAPGLLIGVALGATALQGLDPRWLGVAVGLFLVGSAARHFVSGGKLRLRARPTTFAGVSFVAGALSTVVGASGPIMNPVYLGAGIVKEAMLGTKAASTLLMQVLKIGAFLSIGLLGREILLAGLVVGAGTLVGNALGAAALRRLSVARFEHFVHALVLVAGVYMIARAIGGG